MSERKNSPVLLCVDDEANILHSLERCFFPEGYTIHTALSGAEALQKIEQLGGKVDLVIIDQKMPDMRGDEFLQIARDRFGPLTSIMLSGHADMDWVRRSMAAGYIIKFFAKPWNNQELLAAVRNVFRSSGFELTE